MNLGKFRQYVELKAGRMRAQEPSVTDRRQFILERQLESAKLEADGDDAVVEDLTVTGAFAHQGTTLAFFNGTPATQAAAITQTYAVASATHLAPTAAQLTDSTTGTANATVQDVTAAHNQGILNNNFADLTAQINALIVDHANTKQVLNTVVDLLQRFEFTP